MDGSKLVCAALVMLLSSCAAGTVQEMRNDNRVPGAQGELHSVAEENGNMQVQVKVKHLAKPADLDPAARTYVVWAQDRFHNGIVQNLGAIQVNDNLEGELKSLTSMRRFDVFVTAEPVATAQFPTGNKSLWGTVEE